MSDMTYGLLALSLAVCAIATFLVADPFRRSYGAYWRRRVQPSVPPADVSTTGWHATMRLTRAAQYDARALLRNFTTTKTKHSASCRHLAATLLHEGPPLVVTSPAYREDVRRVLIELAWRLEPAHWTCRMMTTADAVDVQLWSEHWNVYPLRVTA